MKTDYSCRSPKTHVYSMTAGKTEHVKKSHCLNWISKPTATVINCRFKVREDTWETTKHYAKQSWSERYWIKPPQGLARSQWLPSVNVQQSICSERPRGSYSWNGDPYIFHSINKAAISLPLSLLSSTRMISLSKCAGVWLTTLWTERRITDSASFTKMKTTEIWGRSSGYVSCLHLLT